MENCEIEFIDESGSIVGVAVKSYPDGMPLIRQEVKSKVIMVRPRTLESFVIAMFIVESENERGASPPKLVLPFVPGARQDRIGAIGDRLFTSKSVARMINSGGFPSVSVIDPHSEVTTALIDRCRAFYPADFLEIPVGKYAAIVSPDGGAEKRAGGVARKLGIPLLHGWKTRDISNGKITGFGIQPHDLPAGALVLVVDDICDGGGTFVGLADALDAADLRAHLYVTHGIFSKGTDKLLSRYQGHVYCTDSVIASRPGVIEINVCHSIMKREL